LISNLPVPDLINNKDAEAKTIAMVQSEARRLNDAGVTDLFMACNTMHLYSDEMFQGLDVSFHSLIELVAKKLKTLNTANVLLLGTKTTISTNLYQNAMEKNGIKYSKPSDELLLQTVSMILDAISGEVNPEKQKYFYHAISEEAKLKNADLVMLACTELPLLIKGTINGLPSLSSLDVLAEAICSMHYENYCHDMPVIKKSALL